MERFNEAYVNHLNRYTGLRYKDDPAIVAMLITNENDVTHHFANVCCPTKTCRTRIHFIWPRPKRSQHKTDCRRTAWRSWEQGPSKLFLNDLEHKFNVTMIRHLRSLGVKSPIVTTSTSGGIPLSSLPSLTDGDIIDAHSYGGVESAREANPLHAANLIDWIAAAQIVDHPLSVSEWNVEPYRFRIATRFRFISPAQQTYRDGKRCCNSLIPGGRSIPAEKRRTGMPSTIRD